MSISVSKIPYLSHVLNVGEGCRVGCHYCYAGPLRRRIGHIIGCDPCVKGELHAHLERLHISGVAPKGKRWADNPEPWCIEFGRVSRG